MRVLRPTLLTSDMLVSSTIPETDYPAYNPATSYDTEDRCIKGHKIWESAADGNVGNDPEADDAGNWIEVGPTNRFAMLDESAGTLSMGDDGEIEVVLTAGGFNAVGIADTDAASVTITLRVDAVEVYTATKSTYAAGAAPGNWFAWLFDPRERVDTLIFWDVPSLPDAELTVSVEGTNPDGTVSVGSLLIGKSLTIGSTEAGPTLDFDDYSKPVESDFGVTRINKRSYSDRTELRALVETRLVRAIRRELIANRARPMLWEGEEGIDVITLYGFFISLSVNLALANISYVSVTVRSLPKN